MCENGPIVHQSAAGVQPRNAAPWARGAGGTRPGRPAGRLPCRDRRKPVRRRQLFAAARTPAPPHATSRLVRGRTVLARTRQVRSPGPAGVRSAGPSGCRPTCEGQMSAFQRSSCRRISARCPRRRCAARPRSPARWLLAHRAARRRGPGGGGEQRRRRRPLGRGRAGADEDDARARLANVVTDAGLDGPNVRVELLVGSPIPEILGYAEKHDFEFDRHGHPRPPRDRARVARQRRRVRGPAVAVPGPHRSSLSEAAGGRLRSPGTRAVEPARRGTAEQENR